MVKTFFLGRYSLKNIARGIHARKTSSTIMRKINALPVIYGKNKLLEIKSGIKGTTNKAILITHKLTDLYKLLDIMFARGILETPEFLIEKLCVFADIF